MNMKTYTHRILALVLSFIMVFGLMPVTAHAYSWTSGTCSECGTYVNGELCSECHACMDCLATGAAPFHCIECEKCFVEDDNACEASADEGGILCEDCCINFGFHCDECKEHVSGDTWCPVGGKESHCLFCIDNEGGFSCAGCETMVCPFCENVEGHSDCGFCEECLELMMGAAFCEGCGECLNCLGEDEFCPTCFLCKDCTLMCESCYSACNECTIVCEECQTCSSCTDICEDCELCLDCCTYNREDAGCDCTEYCPQSSEFEDHICSSCETPFCVNGHEQCEDCELCEACCAVNSDCTEGMCIENSEYDEHFCLNCYECFDTELPCETCVASGEYYCKKCCAEIVADAGCDCGSGHVAGLLTHMETEHAEEGYTQHVHTADDYSVPAERWSFDATHHWNECRACDPDSPFPGHISKKMHTFGEDHKCTYCGCPEDMAIVIKSQPKKVRSIPVCPADAWPSDELGEFNNYVTFTVSAKSLDPKAELSYQWHIKYTNADGDVIDNPLNDNIGSELDYDGQTKEVPYTSGTKTPTLRMAPVDCEPENKYYYYCLISDENGHTVSTKEVSYTTEHVFIMHTHSDTAPEYPETLYKVW